MFKRSKGMLGDIGKAFLSKKPVLGIDVDEILRAKWLQFDRFYVQEFGEEGAPEKQPYVFDFFKYYKWEETVEEQRELREPDDMPDDINPIDYQLDKDGKSPADGFIFKKKETTTLTAKEVYNRFMYEDFLFEIYGASTMMYKGMDVHLTRFYEKYKDHVEFVVLSRENRQTIPPTLFFLSKILSKFNKYQFVETSEEKWDGIDVLITTDPDILDGGTPEGKSVIKILRPYNEECQDGALGRTGKKILQINDLLDNKKFQKIIKYSEKKKK